MTTERRRVLIRTRPVRYGNYGGILQAYALQRAVTGLGFDAVTDESTGQTVRAHGPRTGLDPKQTLKRVLTRADIPGLTRPDWVSDAVKAHQDAALDEFVSQRIATVSLYAADGGVRTEILDGIDAFIVGSDQVWRAAFGRVPSYMLDFLPADDTRPRIAYAASFGRGDLDEYGEHLLTEASTLLRRFDAISVREASGRELCRDLLGVEASHRIDPTMLLPVEHYRGLAAPDEHCLAPGALVNYVLDVSEGTRAKIASVATYHGLRVQPLLPRKPSTQRAYHRNPRAFARPTVEQWLATLSTARFVVTDSFHGTVFAIMNNVPFVSIANYARGASRFESLLGTIGLADRLVDPDVDLTPAQLSTDIDWSTVNDRIAAARDDGLSFLAQALGHPTTGRNE